MTIYHILAIGLGVLNVFLMLVIYPMRAQIKDVEGDVKDLRNQLQTGYMSKSDFKDHLERIEKTLDEMKGMMIGTIK